MTLKTASVNNRQNVGNWRTGKDFTETVKKLAAENALVVKGEEAKRRVVKIVDAFVAKLPHGEKKEARLALCKKAGIVLRTFERCKEEGEQREEIGASVFEKAEELDYDITPSSIRNLADAKRLNPGATPEEIVRKAKAIDAPQAPRVKEPDTTPTQLLSDVVFKYMDETDNDVDGLFKVLKDQVPQDKLCALLKRFKGACQ